MVHKKLGEKYYKKKAVVEEVRDLYTAIVRVQGLEDLVKIDQTHLETVIPAIGEEDEEEWGGREERKEKWKEGRVYGFEQ